MCCLSERLAERGLNLASLAKTLGVDRSTTSRWASGQVPAERVKEVANATGIPREQLRPDLFSDVPEPTA